MSRTPAVRRRVNSLGVALNRVIPASIMRPTVQEDLQVLAWGRRRRKGLGRGRPRGSVGAGLGLGPCPETGSGSRGGGGGVISERPQGGLKEGPHPGDVGIHLRAEDQKAGALHVDRRREGIEGRVQDFEGFVHGVLERKIVGVRSALKEKPAPCRGPCPSMSPGPSPGKKPLFALLRPSRYSAIPTVSP